MTHSRLFDGFKREPQKPVFEASSDYSSAKSKSNRFEFYEKKLFCSVNFTIVGAGKISVSANVIFGLLLVIASVTRLGDLLDFGQPFKAFGNNKFAQISHILRQFL